MKSNIDKFLKGGNEVSRATLSASKSHDLLVFIGRFQPLHKGHERVIRKAFEKSKNVLILIGSAETASSVRNPFSFEERREMIQAVFPDALIAGINDHTYNDTQWVVEVQKTVKRVALDIANEGTGSFRPNGLNDIRIGLIGAEKDHTSYYLKLFPQWDNISVPFLVPLNATDIRQMWYENDWDFSYLVPNVLSNEVYNLIFYQDNKHERLAVEYEFIKSYSQTWGKGPFLTADALVQVGGNILLIKRGREYGHGLYALPGGFLGSNEKFLDGAIRELKEETRLKVPVPVLKGSLAGVMICDDPHRSERGRIVTACHHFKLENEIELPEVRGSDDADWAGFVDFSELSEKDFFEDHYHIIRKMIGA